MDVEVGSNMHLEKCISKLGVLVKELNKLYALPPTNDARIALGVLLSFVKTVAEKKSPLGQQVSSCACAGREGLPASTSSFFFFFLSFFLACDALT